MSVGILRISFSDDIRLAAALTGRKVPQTVELPLQAADLQAFATRNWHGVSKTLAADGTVIVTFAEPVTVEDAPLAWVLARIDALRATTPAAASTPGQGPTAALTANTAPTTRGRTTHAPVINTARATTPTAAPPARPPAAVAAAALITALLEHAAPEALAQFQSPDGLADGEIYRIAKQYMAQLTGLTLWKPPRRVTWDPLTKPTRAEFATLSNVRATLAHSPLAHLAQFEAAIKATTFDEAGHTHTVRTLTIYVCTAAAATPLWEINLLGAGTDAVPPHNGAAT